MKQMQLSLEEISTSILFIGFEGEQNHTQVTFYWSSIYSKYPNAVAALTIKPPVGDPYPKAITQTGNKVVWIVSASDVANSGSGEYQLTFTDDGEIIKTYIGKFNVYNSIVGNGEAPTPVEDWVYHANEALAEIPGRVKDATDDWLEENISNPDSPPLDRSLSSSAAAAPADLVGDLKRIEKAPVITDTVENADIATFTDGADGMYLHNLVVGIDPVQDLHGQANPYPAGGGKNLLPNRFNPTLAWYGITIERNDDGTYTLNGTSNRETSFDFYINSENGAISDTSALSLPDGDYKFSGITGGSSSTYRLYVALTEIGQTPAYVGINDGDGSFTVNAKKVAMFFRVYPGQSFNNMKIYPMIRIATEDSTFAPYENICPITGWTGANVQRTGKNLFDKNDSDIALNKWINNTTGNLQNSSTGYDTSGYIRVKAETAYTASGFSDTDATEVCFFTKNKNFISGISSSNHTFATPENTYYLRFDYKHIDVDEMMLYEGTTASAYEAFNGQTYPISWQTEAGTVYGGMVDVAAGVLTVTMKGVDLDDLTWTDRYTGTSNKTVSATLPENYFGYTNESPFVMAEEYVTVRGISGISALSDPDNLDVGLWWYKYQTIPYSATVYCVLDKNSTPSGKMVYKLATPVTIQLDPVAVATLFGANNIFADTGAIQSVTYPADTKLYIDKRLAALGGN